MNPTYLLLSVFALWIAIVFLVVAQFAQGRLNKLQSEINHDLLALIEVVKEMLDARSK